MIQNVAQQLLIAEETKQPIAPLTETYRDLTVKKAYYIQLEQLNQRLKQGATLKGLKIGLTSKAMQEMLNVHTPDYGFILDSMLYEEHEPISTTQFIQPKVEFELAFFFKKELSGNLLTIEQVIDAIDCVLPAVEIIDSRIEDWSIQFEDTVADNGSSAGAILGKEKTPFDQIEDITAIPMTVYKNCSWLDEATSAAVLGNPLNAVMWLVREVSEYGMKIKPGMFVLSGALAKAVPFEAGDQFTADFGALGRISVHFAREVAKK